MAVKKKDIWIIVVVVSVLALGLVVDIPIVTPMVKPIRPIVVEFVEGIRGLVEEARPTPTNQPDMPTMTQDEVCALVYNYLESKASATTTSVKRLELLDFLGKATPHFTASYQGNGKWQVWAVGNDGVGAKGNLSGGWGGLWNVYEKSGVIEPANDKARELLNYIQWLTR